MASNLEQTADEHDEHRLRREFSLWTAFAFAFAFISPIVALYAIFGLAISTAGPAFWWNFPIVFGGQLLVALVFAELVSRWPIEGSIYQWSRRLVGDGYGWFAGWAYLWTLIIAMATVALGAAGFVINIIGIDGASGGQQVGIACVILVLGTAANIVGRTVLKVVMSASIVAEIIGSVGLAVVLLAFHRVQPLSVLFEGAAELKPGTYLAFSGPFLLAMAFVGWSFVGFESAGAIAEEVKRPRRNLPKAIIFSLTFIAALVMFSSLAIILAIPDLDAVLSGEEPDPVYSTLVAQLGVGIAKPVQALFVIGFLASFLALQTSASRVIWSYSRDRALPASSLLSRLSAQQRQPVVAITLTALVGVTLFLLSLFATDVYTIMVFFTSGGFYIAFLFPLLGAVWARVTGRWLPGPWTLGRASPWVLGLAVVWALFQFFNIAWPRALNEERWLDWAFWIMAGGLAMVGSIIFATVRRAMTTWAHDELDGGDDVAASGADGDAARRKAAP